MFCPQCGQERISVESKFCSRCGFLLTGVSELLQFGGMIPRSPTSKLGQPSSPRNRGIKQGLFIFLLSFLIVPLVVMATIATRTEPIAVVVTAILLTVGGLLRTVYALMFESASIGVPTPEENVLEGANNLLNRPTDRQALPPQMSTPAQGYVSPAAGNWRDTSDLEPRSVTESTTKLLENDQ